MSIFKLNSVDCVKQQEEGADELYLAVRHADSDEPFQFIGLGGGFTNTSPAQVYKNTGFLFDGKYEVTLWEGDGQFPNFAVDDKIETFYVQKIDPAGPLTLEGNGAVYRVDYDLILQ